MKKIFFILCFCAFSFVNAQTQSLQITKKAKQAAIQPTQFQLSQTTNIPSKVTIRYGLDSDMNQSIESNIFQKEHQILIENLVPSTFYHVQVITETETETIVGDPQIMATASNSTGEIRYYFLNGVDESYSNGATPDGDSYPDVLAAMYDLIDNAQHTIDCAIYNTSWFELVDRLEQAVERGVRVRYIHDTDTNNNALQGNLDFPILAGSPDDGIMHNKFMIVDAEEETSSYVLTGAMNWTFNNITEDHNNTIIIQDKSLAMNYTIEFEEMWGSSGAQPDAGNAKFGEDKEDNTAHLFNIGGVEIECYFSPSDGVTAQIEEVVNSADESLELALLLITRQTVTTAIKDRFFQGVNVRGIFDIETTDEFEFLQSQNVNVVYHFPDIMLHHKYAIADANFPDSDPTVLTGSHNWTQSAETINDENTLIFHDADVANLFLQEFEERWGEVVMTNTNDWNSSMPTAVFPNPFQDNFQLVLDAKIETTVKIELVDAQGILLQASDNQLSIGQNNVSFSLLDVPKGVYFLKITDAEGKYVFSKKLNKQ